MQNAEIQVLGDQYDGTEVFLVEVAGDRENPVVMLAGIEALGKVEDLLVVELDAHRPAPRKSDSFRQPAG